MQVIEDVVHNGKVVLLSGGGKIFTDIAARFVGSEREVEEIADSTYSASIVKKILKSGHLAATEFDYFIFGISGFSRVTEVQLVRKRLASYLIKSGRVELQGKRKFSVVYPHSLKDLRCQVNINGCDLNLNVHDLFYITSEFYRQGLEQNFKEEDLRYLKPQATEFKAIIGMNAHALIDWFGWRCCMKAQDEIRDLAWKMRAACLHAAPDLFNDAGPRCWNYGYCPEAEQAAACREIGTYLPKKEALKILSEHS